MPPGYVRRGDYLVKREKLRAAKESFAKRSEASRARDRLSRAPIERDYEHWKRNQRGLDFPGVDTPTDRPRESMLDDHQALVGGEGDVLLSVEGAEPWKGSKLLGGIAETGVAPEGTAERARDAVRL